MQYFDDLDLIVEAILREESEDPKEVAERLSKNKKVTSNLSQFEKTNLAGMVSLILDKMANFVSSDANERQNRVNGLIRDYMPPVDKWNVISKAEVDKNFEDSISKSFFNDFIKANGEDFNGLFMVNADCLRSTRLKKVAPKTTTITTKQGQEVKAKFEDSKLDKEVTINGHGQECIKYFTVNPSFAAALSYGDCLVATFKTNENYKKFNTKCSRIGNINRRIVGVTSTMPLDAFERVADEGVKGFDNNQASEQAHSKKRIVKRFFSDPEYYSQVVKALKIAEQHVDETNGAVQSERARDKNEDKKRLEAFEKPIKAVKSGFTAQIKPLAGTDAETHSYSYMDACHATIVALNEYVNSIAELNELAEKIFYGFENRKKWAIQLLFDSWDLNMFTINRERCIVDGSEMESPFANINRDLNTYDFDIDYCVSGTLRDLDTHIVGQSDVQNIPNMFMLCNALTNKLTGRYDSPTNFITLPFKKKPKKQDKPDAEEPEELILSDAEKNAEICEDLRHPGKIDSSKYGKNFSEEDVLNFLKKYQAVVTSISTVKTFLPFIHETNLIIEQILSGLHIDKNTLTSYGKQNKFPQNTAWRYIAIDYILKNYVVPKGEKAIERVNSSRMTREIKVVEGIAFSNTRNLMQLKAENFDPGMKKKTVNYLANVKDERTGEIVPTLKFKDILVDYDKDDENDAAVIKELRKKWQDSVAVNIKEEDIIDIVSCKFCAGELTAYVIYCKNDIAHLVLASSDGTSRLVADYFNIDSDVRMETIEDYELMMDTIRDLKEKGKTDPDAAKEAAQYEADLKELDYVKNNIHELGGEIVINILYQIMQRALEMIGVYKAPAGSFSREYLKQLREYRRMRDEKIKEEAKKQEEAKKSAHRSTPGISSFEGSSKDNEDEYEVHGEQFRLVYPSQLIR
jgi:hypothetical protein